MKKLSVIVKEATEQRISKNLKESASFFVVKYSGLSGLALNNLRKSLRGNKAEMFVVKNASARRALKSFATEDITRLIDGPCGLVFAKEEPVAISKVLYTFSKDNEKLKLEGGFLKDRVLDKKDIEALAKLPGREVLLTQVVVGMKAPITGLVMVLKANLRNLVLCLDQIKSKKQ